MTASEPAGPDWRRLHPASLAVNVLPQAWRTARGAWPLLLALVIGGESTGAGAVELVAVLVFTGLTLLRTTVHWATLRYRIHNDRLEIRSGLLNRRARVMDPTRIQNIELVRNLFHKLAGLVEVRMETAGDASTEGLLSALSERDATELRAQLEQIAGRLKGRSQAEPAPAAALVETSAAELIAYGLTRRTVGAVAVLTAVSMEILGRMGPDATREVAWVMRPGVVFAAIVLAFCGSWIFSAGTSLWRHYGYRLTLEGGRIITEEGLTTRRRVEIPLRKVQLVLADEPLMRRLMGYGTVLIETAGLGITDGQMRQAEGVVPMVARASLAHITRHAVPQARVDPWSEPLLPAHPRALYRAVVGRVLRALILAAVLVAVAGKWGWAAVVLVPLAVPVAYLDWRWQGWLVTPTAIVAKRGFFTRRTWIIDRAKLQSAHLVQGPLMRWHGLGRLVVRVAGSEIYLPDIGMEEARGLLEDLSQSGVVTTKAAG